VEFRVHCECGNEVAVPAEDDASATCPECGRTLAAPSSSPPPVPAAARRAGPFKCPFCCEAVDPMARKCPHCQEYLDPALAASRAPGLPTSGLAIASLVVGLVSPFMLCLPGPVAVLLGLGALVASSRGRARGKGMAVAGILLGLVCTALLVLVVAAMGIALSQMPIELTKPTGSEGPLF